MERYRTRALVLRAIDYGESDRIVTLFTESKGRLAAFASGARRSRRRFGGALELFSLVEAHLAERHGAMARLEQVELVDSYGPLREELARVGRASHAAELVRELCPEGEEHPALFEQLRQLFQQLSREDGGALELLHFELALLRHVGLSPRLGWCARCGGERGTAPRFDASHGGILCARCAEGRGVSLSPEALRLLGELQRADQVCAASSLQGAPAPRALAEARRVVRAFLAHYLPRPLESRAVFEAMGMKL